MSGSQSAMIMPLLAFTIAVILGGVVTSQNHDVNLETPYKGMTGKRSVETTTLIAIDPRVEDEGLRQLLTRSETLCAEKLEFLITDTNTRFQSMEYQSSEVHSTVDNIRDELGQNNKILEAKMENILELMDATRSLPSDVEAIKRNVSSLLNVTRSSVNLSSHSESNQIFNKGLQELKDFPTATSTSYPLSCTPHKQYPRNCREVQESDKTACGTYLLQPQYGRKPFEAICDMETRGGGWTVIQRRFGGSQDFYLDWQHYKNGFGNLGGEFWLGLENIHLLTGFEGNELLIELGDFQSQNKSASYSDFRIGSETEGYSLKTLGAYSGDAGDSLTGHVGMKFTTKDNDLDSYASNCAHYCSGAWWYFSCAYSNLNGKYFYSDGQVHEVESVEAIFWNHFKKHLSLKHTKMLVRPKV